MKKHLPVMLVSMFALGCSDSQDNMSADIVDDNTDQRQATMYDAQLDVLDDAKGVEALTLEAAARHRKLLEEQEQ